MEIVALNSFRLFHFMIKFTHSNNLKLIHATMKNKINVLYVHGYNGSRNGDTASTIKRLLNADRYNFISPQFSNRVGDIEQNIKQIKICFSSCMYRLISRKASHFLYINSFLNECYQTICRGV